VTPQGLQFCALQNFWCEDGLSPVSWKLPGILSISRKEMSKRMKAFSSLLLFTLVCIAGCGGGLGTLFKPSPTPTTNLFIYVVGQNGQNIFGFSQDSANTITVLSEPTTGTTLRPAAVLVHPSKNFLYVANFGSNNVTKYSRDTTTGLLTPLGSLPPTPVGNGPIALATDSKGQFLYVLNQTSGSISAFSVDTTRGLLTELAGSPFATLANPTAISVSQSSGFLYVSNGTGASVSGFAIAANGTLSPVSGSPFSAGFSASPNVSWVAVDPKGRFVYAADSANNTIAGFSINSSTGALSPLAGSPFPCGGVHPTGLAMDSNGSFLYVANQASNAVTAFTIGSSSGALTAIPGSPFPSGGAQTTFVTVDPSNKFVYDTNQGSNNVGVSSFDANTGVLTQLSTSPFKVGVTPSWVAISK
jgi:6-phosphogluconolactonase